MMVVFDICCILVLLSGVYDNLKGIREYFAKKTTATWILVFHVIYVIFFTLMICLGIYNICQQLIH